MSKIIDAQDRLREAEDLVQALWLAAHGIGADDCDALQAVADVAGAKIKEVKALLESIKEEERT